MTKSDLVRAFVSKTNISFAHAEFGSFRVREYRGYRGRNPKTNQHVDVKPKKQPFFKADKELKARINRNGGEK